MNLHRASREPDWVAVAPGRRTIWQRLAASTRGLVTPGNIVSLIGLVAVMGALWLVARQAYSSGVAVLLAGRAADLLDGWLAETTGTKGPLGEKIDATFDKVGTFATLLVLAATGIMPWWLAIALLLPHAVIAIIALQALRHGHPLHPSRLGKLSMAVAWVCLPVIIIARASPAALAGPVAVVAYVLAAASIIMGIGAAGRYAAAARAD